MWTRTVVKRPIWKTARATIGASITAAVRRQISGDDGRRKPLAVFEPDGKARGDTLTVVRTGRSGFYQPARPADFENEKRKNNGKLTLLLVKIPHAFCPTHGCRTLTPVRITVHTHTLTDVHTDLAHVNFGRHARTS